MAVMIAAVAGTMRGGSEAVRFATTSTGRGHGVKRTRFVFPSSELAPAELTPAKYDHIPSPVSANRVWGTPRVAT